MAHASSNNQAALSGQTPLSIDDAMATLLRLYDEQLGGLQSAFADFTKHGALDQPATGFYPRLTVDIDAAFQTVPRQAYGFVDEPGQYQSTITRPDLCESYLKHQLEELTRNHACRIFVDLSDVAIPIHFAFPDGLHLEGHFGAEQQALFRTLFSAPDLSAMDDEIVNGDFDFLNVWPRPLALFTAPRVDYSLHRLTHYTGTKPRDFQDFVLFTNYQFYVDGFAAIAKQLVDDPAQPYTDFVEPGGDGHMPQMPAYHLKAPGRSGITLVNIGVGPSNAKTITDHIAVLRPSAWIMLGHCAGLRNTQRLGDYVLAHGYVRDDHVLDADLPLDVPIPALAEIQQALENAVANAAGIKAENLKQVMRTGTVASIDNRNWELRDQAEPIRRFSQSRAIGLDMESATIAANGFRFRIPYGTLLVVSDRPLHGELKLPGMATEFYRNQVDQHLSIGMAAMEQLRTLPRSQLHSRKLRSFNEVPFR